jgi:hypothetical protein
MLATIKIPPPPAPVKARPTRNISNESENPVTAVPMQIMRVEENMQRRGLKTWERRPMRGARDDIAIR